MNEGRRSSDSESEEIERLRLQNKALLYLCVELQASMTDLEKQISHLRSKSNSRQRK
jgi:predicted RNase H-like nuclease (RuvC/YqgF family)